MREFGLAVEYDGKRYTALSDAGVREYGVGEMACELLRLHAYELKDLIVQAPHFHDPLDADQMVEAVYWLRDRMREKYPYVVAEMLSNDFGNKMLEYFSFPEEDRQSCLGSYFEKVGDDKILEYIFEETDYNNLGATTNGQLMLSLYYMVSNEYVLFVAGFTAYLSEDDDPETKARVDGLLSMYNSDHDVQDIDFKIKIYDGGFHSLFIVKSFMSLLLFELAHLFEHNLYIVKCKNCGHYFVPQKRADTKYCSYPAPDCPEKTCKEVGAQKAWASKERTDDVTRAYRKVYMRYKMKINRHPDDAEARERLEQLSAGIREWRKKLANGEAEKNEFLNWLDGFDRAASLADGSGKEDGKNV